MQRMTLRKAAIGDGRRRATKSTKHGAAVSSSDDTAVSSTAS